MCMMTFKFCIKAITRKQTQCIGPTRLCTLVCMTEFHKQGSKYRYYFELTNLVLTTGNTSA